MAGNTSTPGASVVARAFAVLDAFDDRHRSLSLAALARRTGLPGATVHRLCADLVAAGALQRQDSGDYVIGRRLWSTAMLAPVQTGLRELAAPFLHDIHAATRTTVHWAVRDGHRVLYLDRVSGGRSAAVVSRAGSRLPLHTTGVGKILLAHAPPDVVASVLADLTPLTPYTVRQPTTLLRQLERVRRDGYAVTTDEMIMGSSSVAVPISARTADGRPAVAALGVVVDHLGRDRARFVGILQVAAAGIGRALAMAPSFLPEAQGAADPAPGLRRSSARRDPRPGV